MTTNNETINFKDYQEAALKTSGAGGDGDMRLLIATLGLAGEAGEFANIVKKWKGHKHDISKHELRDELGDILWYIAEICSVSGLDMEEVAQQNVDKLKKRYPEGFSVERSRNRIE